MRSRRRWPLLKKIWTRSARWNRIFNTSSQLIERVLSRSRWNFNKIFWLHSWTVDRLLENCHSINKVKLTLFIEKSNTTERRFKSLRRKLKELLRGTPKKGKRIAGKLRTALLSWRNVRRWRENSGRKDWKRRKSKTTEKYRNLTKNWTERLLKTNSTTKIRFKSWVRNWR